MTVLPTLSWREFVATVEASLAEQQLDHDTPIWYIDVTIPNAERLPRVKYEASQRGLLIDNID